MGNVAEVLNHAKVACSRVVSSRTDEIATLVGWLAVQNQRVDFSYFVLIPSMNAKKSELMVINLAPELEAALNEQARQRGVAPDDLVQDTLRNRFLKSRLPLEPQDDWERRLFGAAVDCGVSVPDSALGSDGLYE